MDRAHTVKSFDEEIHQLRSLIGQMGGLAEAQTTDAVNALLRRDADAALKVVAKDVEIDALESEAEQLAISMIALRAPLADDLRVRGVRGLAGRGRLRRAGALRDDGRIRDPQHRGA